jgi:hypothetical protein
VHEWIGHGYLLRAQRTPGCYGWRGGAEIFMFSKRGEA